LGIGRYYIPNHPTGYFGGKPLGTREHCHDLNKWKNSPVGLAKAVMLARKGMIKE